MSAVDFPWLAVWGGDSPDDVGISTAAGFNTDREARGYAVLHAAQLGPIAIARVVAVVTVEQAPTPAPVVKWRTLVRTRRKKDTLGLEALLPGPVKDGDVVLVPQFKGLHKEASASVALDKGDGETQVSLPGKEPSAADGLVTFGVPEAKPKRQRRKKEEKDGGDVVDGSPGGGLVATGSTGGAGGMGASPLACAHCDAGLVEGAGYHDVGGKMVKCGRKA